MNIGIVLAGTVDIDLKQENIDMWIAVDGGYESLIKQNIIPKYLIGDLDSIKTKPEKRVEIIKLNPIKDDTDFEYTLNFAQKFEYKKIFVYGFYSNQRLEHFYSNLLQLKPNITLKSKNTQITLLTKGKHIIENKFDYFSVFAKEDVNGLTYTNAKYPLTNKTLLKTDPLGISNEIIGKKLELEFTQGLLYLYLSNGEE